MGHLRLMTLRARNEARSRELPIRTARIAACFRHLTLRYCHSGNTSLLCASNLLLLQKLLQSRKPRIRHGTVTAALTLIEVCTTFWAKPETIRPTNIVNRLSSKKRIPNQRRNVHLVVNDRKTAFVVRSSDFFIKRIILLSGEMLKASIADGFSFAAHATCEPVGLARVENFARDLDRPFYAAILRLGIKLFCRRDKRKRSSFCIDLKVL